MKTYKEFHDLMRSHNGFMDIHKKPDCKTVVIYQDDINAKRKQRVVTIFRLTDTDPVIERYTLKNWRPGENEGRCETFMSMFQIQNTEGKRMLLLYVESLTPGSHTHYHFNNRVLIYAL